MASHVIENSSVWLAAFALFAFLAAPASASDPFVAVMRIDEQLITGESTKDDVLRFLGKPTGAGKARFPPGWESQEVWYYLEEKVTGIHSEYGYLEADVRVRTILIFFRSDRFSSYMWYGAVYEREEGR